MKFPKPLLQRLLPPDLRVPDHLPRRLLAKTGYFRLRTWLAAHGTAVPDAHLYLPTFSPWEGEESFERVYRRIHPYTLVSRDRCYVLWKTLQQAVHIPGEFVECGVFRGGTALLAAETIQGLRADRALHLFDTFTGMDVTTPGIDRFGKGDFANTSLAAVRRLLEPFAFVHIHPGLIPDTFSGVASLERVAWAHVDVDLYETIHACIAFLYPRLVPGGFLIFDDYGFPTCPGARRAVDEAFARLREVPITLPTGQCLVVKL